MQCKIELAICAFIAFTNTSLALADQAHFHHVHLNVTDPVATMDFYQTFFGANPVRYRGHSDGLFTEKSFILLDKIDNAAPSHINTTLWHIGWAGVDGASEFAWRKNAGIAVHTPITPLEDIGIPSHRPEYFMYFYGPDGEIVEVYTGNRNHRFEHVHLIASDLDQTVEWFRDHLGLTPSDPIEVYEELRLQTIRVDNVNIIIFQSLLDDPPGWWPPTTYAPTRGTVVDHIGFSYARIDEVHSRMRSEIDGTSPISRDSTHHMKRFFIPGPDGLLVEIVEEAPIPEGIWE
jgi:catechol 2,3-dioxygenase-like lactoylglutathione lyase family enzyme